MDPERENYADPEEPRPNDWWPRVVGAVIAFWLLALVGCFALDYLVASWP